MSAGKIISFEALIRWQNKEFGLVSPDKFIKIAEDTGLILPIGLWVLREACTFIKSINEKEIKDYIISVNISVLQLIKEDFIDTVLKVLDNTGLNPHNLELGITESILIYSIDNIIEKLNLLKKKYRYCT